MPSVSFLGRAIRWHKCLGERRKAVREQRGAVQCQACNKCEFLREGDKVAQVFG